LVGNFAFPVFIKNQLVAADDEIKIAAYLFPDFEKQHAGNISFALKNDSMALFIGAERFPRIAFQENKQVVWSPINWRFHL
jgi:hypothetical protein